MKQKIKYTLIIILVVMLMAILYCATIYGGAMLLAHVFVNIETPTYEIELSENNIIDNEDKEKIIQVLELKNIPANLNVTKLKYNSSFDGDDGYDITFEISKNIEDDNCIYEYQCGSFGR